jgi:DNA polymerase-3 subunit delta'
MTTLTYQNIPFPWQTEHWNKLLARFRQGTLPHALLLAGEAGFGQSLFAKALARAVLCDQDQAQLQLFDSENHPDFFHVQPEEESSVIKIDQIRALQTKLTQSKHSSQYSVVILEPAHALNAAASNALLKCLEEPNANTLLILVSSQTNILPATLRSRCQTMTFTLKESKASLEWLRGKLTLPGSAEYFLKLAEGAPLKALALAEPEQQRVRKNFLIDVHALVMEQSAPTSIAEKWLKHDPDDLLQLLANWLGDVVRLHHGALQPHTLPSRYYEILCHWQNKLAATALFTIIDSIYELRRSYARIEGLSKNLVENCLIQITQKTSRR